MDTQEQEYVLGTNSEELQRLGLQSALWRDYALGLWNRAGFGPGHSLLDIGCGPGYTTRDLARQVGPTGRVLGVDASARFVGYLESLPPDPGAAPIEARVQDVQELDLPPESLDGAYERWCFCFVADPEKAVRAVARALKPGGAFCLHEYVHYECMRLAPRSPAFERLVQVVADSFRAMGGDPDVGCRLPGLLAGAGLEITHLEPIVRVARPGQELWQWPETFFLSYAGTLHQRGLFSEVERRAFEADWKAWSGRPEAAFYSPMLVGLVARKPA